MKRDAFLALAILFALMVTSVFGPAGSAHRSAASGVSVGTSRNSKVSLNSITSNARARRAPAQEGSDPIDQRRLLGARLGIAPPSAQPDDPSAKKQLGPTPDSGEPRLMKPNVPFSAGVAVTVGGRDTHFNNVSVLGDFDGLEDLTADHEGIERDFVGTTLPSEFTLTRVAISEHTRANGFNENIFYYGDSLGNLYVDATDLSFLSIPNPPPNRFSINLPTALNAFGTLQSDSQIVITGIAVNPVADLTSFANVNGAYAPFAGKIGEVVFVAFTDTGSGLRLTSNNTLVRSGILAYPVADIVSPAPAPPGIVSPAGFPVQMANAFGVVFSIFSNLAGVAVDDDGSAYFQQVDLTQFTGANIVKIQDVGSNQDRSPATNGFLFINTLNPSNGLYGTASGPPSQVNRFTNYSGTSPFFGNISALATGPGNALYAAVARSFVATDDPATQNTEGLFTNPAAIGPTPAMVISFADVIGAFDNCSTAAIPGFGNQGLPIGDGKADPAGPGTSISWRAYVLGTGPDKRTSAAPLSAVFGSTSDTQKVEFQVDFSIYSGLMLDEGGRLYLVSGGTPGGVGLNPSPRLGEILCFEDTCPTDRRGDYTDLRADLPPNPPLSGGNTGDGDSDRFDHIFWQAPMDLVTATPTGIAGIARGFLRYLNRTATNAITNLPNGTVQGDDATTAGVVNFEDFDPSSQVAGGDDQNPPFAGDDSDGGGMLPLVGPLKGGFEYLFGGTGTSVWNGFFLNSNGSVSFGAGDIDNTPTVPEFRAGVPKIAGAWADLNPSSRGAGFLNTFPVQAVGFAGVNQFKVRWIGVPEFGGEGCSSINTFSVSLYDDGTGVDENANQPLNPANPIGNNVVPFNLQEGPTDQRWVVEPSTGTLVPTPLRREGSGNFVMDYGRMDLLGTDSSPVITGYSIGGTSPLNPPGLCETNLSTGMTAVEGGLFGVLQGQTAGGVDSCLIGEGTEPSVYEVFQSGKSSSVGPQGEVFTPVPDFDLRFPGNDPAASKPSHQPDQSHETAGLFGIGTALPTGLKIFKVIPGTFSVTPTSRGLINAIGGVELNLVGSGFFPNEVTTVCETGVPTGDIPTPRPGKTVSNAITFAIDSDGDGIAEATVALTNVTAVNRNLVRGTLAPLPGLPGTPFPLPACGGLGTATLSTTFTAGDNNIFFVGPPANPLNTRTATGTLVTDVRAPVVLGVTPVEGDCSAAQDVILGGSCFLNNVFLPGSPSVTKTGPVAKVFAVEQGNPSNIIQAVSINTLDNNTVAARFNLGAANAGKRFLIFATGPDIPAPGPGPTPSPTPGYTSRNISTGTPLGNEAGNLVTFSCGAALNNAISLSASNYNVTEDCTVAALTITRSLPSTDPVTVDVATSDGSAVQKSDYTATFRTISFAPGETSKVLEIPITEDSFNEANETFTVTLSNPTGGAGLGGQTAATVTIVNDDNPPPPTNAIDDVANFVGQHYHDFLNRQADAAGQAFWVSQITACGANVACIEQARISVSASFFLSIEFQETGFFVLRSQRVAFGRKSEAAATRYPYFSFLKDTQQVSQGVIIGQPGANALLEANKQAYATQVVTSGPFITAYPLAQTASDYVDALFATAMVVPTAAERTAAITAFGGGGTSGRVAAFRSVVDAASVRTAESNPAFVLMEYYGYLRRNPTDPPDGNDVGYQFWLTKLNMFGGNFINAEMVKAFLSSMEYRQRFGTP